MNEENTGKTKFVKEFMIVSKEMRRNMGVDLASEEAKPLKPFFMSQMAEAKKDLEKKLPWFAHELEPMRSDIGYKTTVIKLFKQRIHWSSICLSFLLGMALGASIAILIIYR